MFEIEGVIAEHPAVAEASVFGIPDERLGESLATRIPLNQDKLWMKLNYHLSWMEK